MKEEIQDQNEKRAEESSVFSRIKSRWYTNEEVASILKSFGVHPEWQTSELQIRPKSGAVLLYSREKVRYRQDGYCWKKRKNGRTTREDHMKLKVQGIECIYGCYVHSAILPTFHRRCYWLLENPDIVLVHYLNQPPDNDKEGKMMITLNSSLLEATTRRSWSNEEIIEEIGSVFGGISQIQHTLNINFPAPLAAPIISQQQPEQTRAVDICDLEQVSQIDQSMSTSEQPQPQAQHQQQQSSHVYIDDQLKIQHQQQHHHQQHLRQSIDSSLMDTSNWHRESGGHSSIVCAMDLATCDLADTSSASLILDNLYSPPSRQTTNRSQQPLHLQCCSSNMEHDNQNRDGDTSMTDDDKTTSNKTSRDHSSNPGGDDLLLQIDFDQAACDVTENDVMHSMATIDSDDLLIGGNHNPSDHHTDANSLELFNFRLATGCHTPAMETKSAASVADYGIMGSASSSSVQLNVSASDSGVAPRCHSTGGDQMLGSGLGSVSYNHSASQYLGTDCDLVGQNSLLSVGDNFTIQRSSACSLNPTSAPAIAPTEASCSTSCSPAPFSTLSLQVVGLNTTVSQATRLSSGIETCSPSCLSDLSSLSSLQTQGTTVKTSPSEGSPNSGRYISKQRSSEHQNPLNDINHSHNSNNNFSILVNGPLSKAFSLDGGSSNLPGAAGDSDHGGNQNRAVKSSTPIFDFDAKTNSSGSYFFIPNSMDDNNISSGDSSTSRVYSQSSSPRRHQSLVQARTSCPPLESFPESIIPPNSSSTTTISNDTSSHSSGATNNSLALPNRACDQNDRGQRSSLDYATLGDHLGCQQPYSSSTSSNDNSSTPQRKRRSFASTASASDDNASALMMFNSVELCPGDGIDGTSLLPILDYVPNWCSVTGGAKVLIIGHWNNLLEKNEASGSVDGNNNSSNEETKSNQKSSSNSSEDPKMQFSVMFDDILVPATLIQDNVLKCHAPNRRQGFITLEVLHRDRIVSEQVLFEMRQTDSSSSSSSSCLHDHQLSSASAMDIKSEADN